MAPLPSFQALGTTWWIELFDDQSETQQLLIRNAAAEYLREFEAQYSRFLPTSLISRLNHDRVLTEPPPPLSELLTLGQQLATQTAGAFNFLIGDHLTKRGYDAQYSFRPQAEPSHFPNPNTDLTITADRIELHAGAVDLGGFGKGYAIDRVAELLTTTFGQREFLIHGGGDLYGTTEHDQPITIYLEHPTSPQTLIASTTLNHQGFAASSQHKRAWKVANTTYTHIVQTTELSLTPPDGVFVKAPNAVTADAYATTLLIQPEMAQSLTTEQIGLAQYLSPTNRLTATPGFLPLTPLG